jgi:hypothetical protein
MAGTQSACKIRVSFGSLKSRKNGGKWRWKSSGPVTKNLVRSASAKEAFIVLPTPGNIYDVDFASCHMPLTFE